MENSINLTNDEKIFLLKCITMSAREGFYLSNRWKLENIDDQEVVNLLEKLLGGGKHFDNIDSLEFMTDDDIKEMMK